MICEICGNEENFKVVKTRRITGSYIPLLNSIVIEDETFINAFCGNCGNLAILTDEDIEKLKEEDQKTDKTNVEITST